MKKPEVIVDDVFAKFQQRKARLLAEMHAIALSDEDALGN